MQANVSQAQIWSREMSDLSFELQFEYVLKKFKSEKVVVASSLSHEDQVITHAYKSVTENPRVFFLDTGRHYEETYKILHRSRDFFDIKYEVYAPPTDEVEALISKRGPYSFYDSVELRKECCYIRKVIPLQKVLRTAELWMTGIRSEQSANRSEVKLLEWDEVNGLYKFNPLVGWKDDEVKNYVKNYHLPTHPLFDKGFLSIGCSPCTRQVQPGEDSRRGRWWWEDSSHNECGLHKR